MFLFLFSFDEVDQVAVEGMQLAPRIQELNSSSYSYTPIFFKNTISGISALFQSTNRQWDRYGRYHPKGQEYWYMCFVRTHFDGKRIRIQAEKDNFGREGFVQLFFPGPK